MRRSRRRRKRKDHKNLILPMLKSWVSEECLDASRPRDSPILGTIVLFLGHDRRLRRETKYSHALQNHYNPASHRLLSVVQSS